MKLSGLKKCKVCEAEKQIIEFSVANHMKDGRNSKCKDCHKAYLFNYRRNKNKDKIKDREEKERKKAKLAEKRLKECSICYKEKPVSEFSVRRASPDGLCGACGICSAEKQREQYKDNKKYYLDRNRELRSKNREKYRETKEGKPCAHCGGLFPQVCMDYDHIDPKTKKLCVAQMMGYSWKDIEKEISKCELICSNCHRIKTYETTNRQKQHTITTCYKRPRPKRSDS